MLKKQQHKLIYAQWNDTSYLTFLFILIFGINLLAHKNIIIIYMY